MSMNKSTMNKYIDMLKSHHLVNRPFSIDELAIRIKKLKE